MSPAKIAVCQILSTNDPEHNLAISTNVVRKAHAAGAVAADFIAGPIEEVHRLSAPLSSHSYTLGLQKLAKELSITISAGVHELPEADEKDDEPEGSLRVYNTHVLIGKNGKLLARYRKLHLFDVLLTKPQEADGTQPEPQKVGESEKVRPGQEIIPPVTVDGLGKVGLSICYDIRFPELHMILTRMGADALTFPSAFMLKTGRAHWMTLNRGIAIQMQTYVISSGQYGVHNPNRTSWGESTAFDPWGRELGRLRSWDDTKDDERASIDALYKESGEYFLCDIDLDTIKDTRTQLPLELQKRKDVYGVVGKQVGNAAQ